MRPSLIFNLDFCHFFKFHPFPLIPVLHDVRLAFTADFCICESIGSLNCTRKSQFDACEAANGLLY